MYCSDRRGAGFEWVAALAQKSGTVYLNLKHFNLRWVGLYGARNLYNVDKRKGFSQRWAYQLLVQS